MTGLAAHAYRCVGTCDHEGAEELLSSWLAVPAFALAYGLLNEGFSVMPLGRDGKIPARKWKRLQTEYATIDNLVHWFTENDFTVAIVTGKLSGITVIDCDCDKAEAAAIESGLDSSMTQRTRRGIHFIFQHDGERNTVRVNGIEKVDRRGEGGYVKAYDDCASWTRESVQLAGAL